MKYIIFYNVTETEIFSFSKKENSYFLTKEEVQKKVEEALLTIPMTRIHILKKVKTIRKGKKYLVLSLENTLGKPEFVLFPDTDRVFDYEDLEKHKDQIKDKIIAERFYRYRIKVKIGK